MSADNRSDAGFRGALGFWLGTSVIGRFGGVGIIAGMGGLCGGYSGAHLRPGVPQKALRLAPGVLAIATTILYVAQAG